MNVLLGVALTLLTQLQGWTQFTPSADTRIVYVSSSTGSDNNDGLSETSPKQTIAAGIELLRHEKPDWLLLKAGDTWHESLSRWQKSGRSETEKLLISYYGTGARPLLLTGNAGGIWTNMGGGTPPNIDHWAIVGLNFRPDTYNGHGACVGVELLKPTNDFLLEDCVLQGYSTNIVLFGFYGQQTHLSVRRCIVVDAYSLDVSNPQGIYVDNVSDLLLQENVFDHNGWLEGNENTATVFNHNVYIDNHTTNAIIENNIIANASSHGVQLRCNGRVTDNLFARNAIGLLVGTGSIPGVIADVRNNVIIDGKNINSSLLRGWGIILDNIQSGNVINNVIAHNVDGQFPQAVSLVGNSANSVGVLNVNFSNNTIFDWGWGVFMQGDSSQLHGLVWRRNAFQDHVSGEPLLEFTHQSSVGGMMWRKNTFYRQSGTQNNWMRVEGLDISFAEWQAMSNDQDSIAQNMNFVDVNRSVGSYNGTLGGIATHNALMQSVRNRPLHQWDPALSALYINTYIRRGFKQI